MPKEKTITVYNYSELSAAAKERARSKYLEYADHSFEWDCIKDDSKSIGLKLFGTDRGTMTGELIESAYDCASRIIKEHGHSCETFKTASAFFEELARREKKFEMAEGKTDGSEYDTDRNLADLEAEFLRDILEDYRIMTEKQEEYCQSEEYIKQVFESNEYEFDINGNRI